MQNFTICSLSCQAKNGGRTALQGREKMAPNSPSLRRRAGSPAVLALSTVGPEQREGVERARAAKAQRARWKNGPLGP